MRELDTQFPDYGFAKHKGYITKFHTESLQAHGPCIEHRRSFANIAALL
jgi:ribonuclease HII